MTNVKSQNLSEAEESEIRELHIGILESIREALKNEESDITQQFEIFKKSKSNKKYRATRNDKDYVKWKKDVIERFKGHCCVCLSKEKVMAHHLNSYKYFLHLRTNLDNGVCLCSKCHIAFHDFYDNWNTIGQFFEFIQVMKNEKLKNYISKSIRVRNFNSLCNKLVRKGENFKLIELEHLKLIVISEKIIYSGVRSVSPPYR